MNNDHKVWLITGASSGLGKALAEAAIANGDRGGGDRPPSRPPAGAG